MCIMYVRGRLLKQMEYKYDRWIKQFNKYIFGDISYTVTEECSGDFHAGVQQKISCALG